MQKYFYESEVSDNFVLLLKNNDRAYLVKYYIDTDKSENIPEFYLMLKRSLEKVKNDGILYFYQNVDKNEWENNLINNEKWEISEKYDNYYEIFCDINDACDCIIDGFFI